MVKNFDIFLSYNWASKNLAVSLFKILTQTYSLKVWMDDLELDSRMLYQQLCDGINNSKCFLCLVTKKYSESDNCIREINFATISKTPLIIAMLEELDISKIGSVGFIIASLTRFNYFEEKDVVWSGRTFENMMKSILSNISNCNGSVLSEMTTTKKTSNEEIKHNEYLFPNGDKYIGNIEDNKPHGYGIYIYTKTNERYEGEFQKNKKHGTGTHFYESGDVYQGTWIADKRSGHGVYKHKSGAKYDGEYLMNEKHGHGKYYYRNGDVYDGMWLNDKQTGKGVLFFSHGEKYEGEFLDEEFHGFGVYTYSDGTRYEGMWSKGEKSGKGTIIYSDGNSHEENF